MYSSKQQQTIHRLTPRMQAGTHARVHTHRRRTTRKLNAPGPIYRTDGSGIQRTVSAKPTIRYRVDSTATRSWQLRLVDLIALGAIPCNSRPVTDSDWWLDDQIASNIDNWRRRANIVKLPTTGEEPCRTSCLGLERRQFSIMHAVLSEFWLIQAHVSLCAQTRCVS